MRNTQLTNQTACKALTDRHPAINLVTVTMISAAFLFVTSKSYAENRIAIGENHSVCAVAKQSQPCSVEAFYNNQALQQEGRFSLTRQLNSRSNSYLIIHGTELRIKMVF